MAGISKGNLDLALHMAGYVNETLERPSINDT
jgi:hypothetical protein